MLFRSGGNILGPTAEQDPGIYLLNKTTKRLKLLQEDFGIIYIPTLYYVVLESYGLNFVSAANRGIVVIQLIRITKNVIHIDTQNYSLCASVFEPDSDIAHQHPPERSPVTNP